MISLQNPILNQELDGKKKKKSKTNLLKMSLIYFPFIEAFQKITIIQYKIYHKAQMS